MHTGRDREKLSDVIEDQFHFLERSLQIAADAGVAREGIVLDPGFGFAKDTNENLELMARFPGRCMSFDGRFSSERRASASSAR